MSSILVILSFILMISLNIFGYSSEKKLLKRIDELDERLSVLDGGSKILKKYIKHSPEVRICDLENRLQEAKEKNSHKSIYFIDEFSGISSPRVVQMSFELPYLDWCRFENSEIFRKLTAYLEELEKQEIRIENRNE